MLSHTTSYKVDLFVNEPTSISNSNKDMLGEKLIKEKNMRGDHDKPNTFMKRRMQGTNGLNTQLVSSKVSYISLILMGLLLIGRPVLAETQEERDLQGGNSSSNELFSNICTTPPPQTRIFTQRPELEKTQNLNVNAEEDSKTKLLLKIGSLMLEASKDHPYVAALFVILVCFALCFCWMFWFDLIVFTMVFVIFWDSFSELLDGLLYLIFGWPNGLKMK